MVPSGFENLWSYSIDKMQPGICQFFPTNACMNLTSSNLTENKKKEQTHNRFTSTTDIFSKKYLFFLSFFNPLVIPGLFFPFEGQREPLKLVLFPLSSWSEPSYKLCLKYPLPSCKALRKSGPLQRDTIMTTHTTWLENRGAWRIWSSVWVAALGAGAAGAAAARIRRAAAAAQPGCPAPLRWPRLL